jgi:hypothetical protein
LQQLLWIIQQFVGLLGVHAQRARRELRGHGRLRHRRIRRHETYFIHVDVGIALQRGFQLLGQLNRLRPAAGREPANESCQARLRHFR